MLHYLAKIHLTPDGASIDCASGLEGVTAELFNGGCRLRHPLFGVPTAYAQVTLMEQNDREATPRATNGDGLFDVLCSDVEGHDTNNFSFQIRIDVEA